MTERDNFSLERVWSGAAIVSDPYAYSNGIMMHIRALAILEVASKLMYLAPEPGWEAALSAEGSNAASPANQAANPYGQYASNNTPYGQSYQQPLQDIDDFLRSQNFAAAAMTNGMPASMMDTGSGVGSGGMDFDMTDTSLVFGMRGNGPMGGNGSSPANSSGSVPARSKAWTRTARIRNPKAYEECRMALLRLEADLPPERRTNWEVWDGVCLVDVAAGAKRGGISLVSFTLAWVHFSRPCFFYRIILDELSKSAFLYRLRLDVFMGRVCVLG